jgi:hypothetical protein
VAQEAVHLAEESGERHGKRWAARPGRDPTASPPDLRGAETRLLRPSRSRRRTVRSQNWPAAWWST